MNRSVASGFVKSVLQNGVGRFVCQLQRITLKFCKEHGGSRGVREYIETDLVDFAKDNPGTVVYLKPRRHRSPAIVAEYLNGERDYVTLHNFSKAEVVKHMEYMLNKSGIPILRLKRSSHTDSPSIQGIWTPFSRIDPSMNIASFPDNTIAAKETQLSASEILKKLAENAKHDQSQENDEPK